MQWATLSVLTWISFRDIRTHRIKHGALLVLMISLTLQPRYVSSIALVVIGAALTLLLFITDIGMGDIKLLTILAIYQGSYISTPTFLFLFCLASIISLLVHRISTGSFQGGIALAPAISAAFAGCYLGI